MFISLEYNNPPGIAGNDLRAPALDSADWPLGHVDGGTNEPSGHAVTGSPGERRICELALQYVSSPHRKISKYTSK